MNNVTFTKAWVHCVLDQIAEAFALYLKTKYESDDNTYLEKIDTAINSWTRAFEQKCSWTLLEFLIACIGDFIFAKLNEQQFDIPNNIADCQRGVRVFRSKNIQDIVNLKKQFDEILDEKYHQLKNLTQQESTTEVAMAFHWLDKIIQTAKANKTDYSIQRFIKTCAIHTGGGNKLDACVPLLAPSTKIALIPKRFSEHILYLHYNLDPEKAKSGLPIPNLLTVDEACSALKINRPNLFKLCANQGIGVYVRKQTFKLETHFMENDIEDISDFIDHTYLYPYDGLVRLRRDKKINYGKSDVYAFYEGNEISLTILSDKPSAHTYWSVYLQPSISEIIQGKLIFFHMLPDQKITIDDLWLIQDEALKYKKNMQKKNACKKNGKLSGKSRSDEADKKWNEIKPKLLKLAENLRPVSANRIAQIAVDKKLIDYDVSTIAKKIRIDKDFSSYLKGKK
ncbi:TPA: hypothetical protein ACPSKY_002572 [Legionella bozemanae]